MHYRLKCRTLAPLFSHVLFGFQPYILDRVLVWCIRCKYYTRYPPFIAWQFQIDRFKIFLHFDTAMIRCTVPEQNEALAWVVLAKIFNKDGCPISIGCLGWNYDGLTRKWFDRTLIGLSLTKIGHRDFDPLCAWPP